MVLYNERVISHPRVAKQNEADRFQPSNSGRSIRHLRCDNSPITTCALRAAQAAPQTTGGGFSASCEERVRVLGSQVSLSSMDTMVGKGCVLGSNSVFGPSLPLTGTYRILYKVSIYYCSEGLDLDFGTAI